LSDTHLGRSLGWVKYKHRIVVKIVQFWAINKITKFAFADGKPQLIMVVL